jgi:hypothetical protein
MQIQFKFQPEKAIAVMGYILTRLGPTDRVKLMKMIYLADREHFIRTGVPITGDRQCAMDYGPVPSQCLNLLGDASPLPRDYVFRYLHLNDFRVEMREAPSFDQLGDSERAVLDEIISSAGPKDVWKLVRETHKLPEYTESFVEGTSRPIPYERIAAHSNNDDRFRHGRMVISVEAGAQIDCPFPPADPDL